MNAEQNGEKPKTLFTVMKKNFSKERETKKLSHHGC